MRSYKDLLKEIRTAKEEYQKAAPLMSEWQRQTIAADIREKKAAYSGAIYQAVKTEMDTAIVAYKNALIKTAAARTKEIASWESGKLRDELELAKIRVQNAFENREPGRTVTSRVKAIYEDALASGDRYKIRAVAEVLNGAGWNSKLPRGEGAGIDIIGGQAAEQLQKMLRTDAVIEAEQGEARAAEQLVNTRNEVYKVGELMGDVMQGMTPVGRYWRLFRRVDIDAAGKLSVLDEDDPRITGVDLSKLDDESIAAWRKDQGDLP